MEVIVEDEEVLEVDVEVIEEEEADLLREAVVEEEVSLTFPADVNFSAN